MKSLVVLVLLVACGEVVEPPSGSFTVTSDVATSFIRQSEAAFVEVTVMRGEGFTDAVAISLAEVPTGITTMPLELAVGETTGTLTIIAEGTTVQGATIAQLVGTSGDEVNTTDLRLLVGGAPGTLDQSFAEDGTFTPELGGLAMASRALTLTEQGIIVTGFVVSSPPQAITVRILEDGTLDTAYGTDGFVSTGVGGLAEGIAIAPLADGATIVSGIAGGGGGECEYGVFKYDAFGTLDATFGASGVATIDPGAGCAEFHNVVLARDGGVFVGGTLFANPATTHAFKFTAAGIREPGFDIVEPGVFVEAAIVQADDKFVMSGSLSGDFWIARYNFNGTHDGGFGTNGVVTTPFGNDTANANGIIAVAGGKLLAIGICAAGTNKRVCLARYNANGSLDVTFGGGGTFTSATAFDSRTANAVVVSGSDILFGGVRNQRPAVTRFRDTGTVDTSFGDQGVAEVDFGVLGTTNATGSFGLAVDADGRIVISGDVGPAGGQKMAVARLWP